MYTPIAEDQPVLIKLKSDSGMGSANAHWALIISLNADNSITVYDPTSAIASSQPWSLGAVASRTDTAFALTLATSTTTDQQGQTTTDDASADTQQ